MLLTVPLRLLTYTFLCALLIGCHFDVSAQLTVNTSPTPSQLATILTGPGVQISGVTRTCPSQASGSFDASSTNIAVQNGVLLTSGQAQNATSPNTGGGIGTDNYAPGDPDLTALAGVTTFDACVIEFDVIASCDTIAISYVFASEEYDEYVCANVNDAFGFFISGPGVPFQNIALVPGTTTPVSINTVNNGSVGTWGTSGSGCILGNSAYYTSNAGGITHEYDGMTVRMVAKHWVQPCSTYHIKLAVADGGDGIFDSGVFLEAGGIGCIGNTISINAASASGGNTLVEGCNDGVIYFERSGDLSLPYTVNYRFVGTAQNGVDCNLLPGSLTFPAGADSVGVTITPVDDGVLEGVESLMIIYEDSVCNTVFADTSVILISDPPNANFSSTDVCAGQTINFVNNSTFTGGPIIEHKWDFGDGTTSTLTNPPHGYNTAGTYQVKLVITTIQGCKDSIIQPVEIFQNPLANFSWVGECAQNPTQYTGLSSANGGSPIVSWNWNFGNGTTSTDQNPSMTFPTAGTYTVFLSVTNADGCTVGASNPVVIEPLPEVAFTQTTVCQGNVTQFTDQTTIPAGAINDWEWHFGDGTTSNQQNPGHIYPAAGTYDVTLIVGSAEGCRDSLLQTIEVWPNPQVDFLAPPICFGDTTHFVDQTTILSGSIVGWQWDFGDGNTSSAPNPSNLYSQPGTYVITLTVTSDQGCTSTLTQETEVFPSPVIPVPVPDTVCLGETAVLQAIVPPGVIVKWYYDRNSTQPFHIGTRYETAPLAQSELYFLEAVTPDGCISRRVTNWVKVWKPVNLQTLISPTEVEIPNAIVEFSVIDPSGVVLFAWDFGDGSGSGSPNAIHQYTDEGVYDIRLTVIDEHGCERIIDHNQWVTVEQHIALHVPNAFTPNGDGINDEFFVTPRLITDLEIIIVDRWGKVIFESQDLNFRWNGNDTGGEPAPEGVYAYKIEATLYDGKSMTYAGTIHLIR